MPVPKKDPKKRAAEKARRDQATRLRLGQRGHARDLLCLKINATLERHLRSPERERGGREGLVDQFINDLWQEVTTDGWSDDGLRELVTVFLRHAPDHDLRELGGVADKARKWLVGFEADCKRERATGAGPFGFSDHGADAGQ